MVVAQWRRHRRRRWRRVEAVVEGAMPKSMQSGHRATHARVCQARERIGDDGHAPVLPIPDVQGRMHNQTPSPRDQQRRPPWRSQAQKKAR